MNSAKLEVRPAALILHSMCFAPASSLSRPRVQLVLLFLSNSTEVAGNESGKSTGTSVLSDHELFESTWAQWPNTTLLFAVTD